MQGQERDTQRIITLNNNEPKPSLLIKDFYLLPLNIFLWHKYTLPTVASIKPTGQDIAGLVAKFISEPGICTSLITVRDTVYSSSKLPGLSKSNTPGSPATCNIATPSAVTCTRGRRTESYCTCNLKKKIVPYFLRVFSRLMHELQSERVHLILY